MKRKIAVSSLLFLGIVALGWASLSYPFQHWRAFGTGSTRDTVQFEIVTLAVGGSAVLRPGTDNANALGTSSLRFSDVQTYNATIAGNTTLGDATGDTVTVNGDPTFANTSRSAYTPNTVYALLASSTIATDSNYVLIGSSGGAITLTSTPNIATTTASAGTICIFRSTGPAVTLQSDSALGNSQVILATATTISISSSTARAFLFDGTNWVQIP